MTEPIGSVTKPVWFELILQQTRLDFNRRMKNNVNFSNFILWWYRLLGTWILTLSYWSHTITAWIYSLVLFSMLNGQFKRFVIMYRYNWWLPSKSCWTRTAYSTRTKFFRNPCFLDSKVHALHDAYILVHTLHELLG